MPQVVKCSECQRALRVPDEFLGRRVRCPSCGTEFTATAPDAAEDEDSPGIVPEAPPPKREERESRRRRPGRRRHEDDAEDEDRPWNSPGALRR